MKRVPVFAFGSNLDWEQIIRRCPSVRIVGAGVVENERLAFAGKSRGWGGAVATLVPAKDKVAVGMVYSMLPQDLVVLDAVEGHPRFYVREYAKVTMLRTDGEEIEAWTYRLERPFAPPTPAYVSAIRRGYEHWGFPLNWLRNAIKYSRRHHAKARKELPCFPRSEP